MDKKICANLLTNFLTAICFAFSVLFSLQYNCRGWNFSCIVLQSTILYFRHATASGYLMSASSPLRSSASIEVDLSVTPFRRWKKSHFSMQSSKVNRRYSSGPIPTFSNKSRVSLKDLTSRSRTSSLLGASGSRRISSNNTALKKIYYSYVVYMGFMGSI